MKVRIEDGATSEIQFALKKLPSVQQVDLTDPSMNRFEVQSKPSQSSKREIFMMCVEKNWVLTEINALETRLEDIFRNLTMN